MNCPHDPTHDMRLQEIFTDGAPATSAAADELRACPFCAEHLAVLSDMTARLDSAGREQRSILSDDSDLDHSEFDGGDRERIRQTVRAGLAQRDAVRRRPTWPWFLIAAAALVVVAVWWAPLADDGGGGGGTGRTRDQLLHGSAAWPKGAAIDASELLRDGFRWPGHADETFVLLLFEPSNPLDVWDTIECRGPVAQIDQALLDRMLVVGDVWDWQCRRTSPQVVGSASVELTDLYRFEFSR